MEKEMRTFIALAAVLTRNGTTMRRMVSSLLAAMVGLSTLVTAASPANAATLYTFTQLDVPNASLTVANGINDAGQIVGNFVEHLLPNFPSHGFLRDSDGQFMMFDVPGENGTTPFDINDAGQIIGFAGSQSFLFTGGSFTPLELPGNRSSALGINNLGQIVGGIGTQSGQGEGFIDTNGSLTLFAVPGALHTSAWSINDAGQVVGSFGSVVNESHGFLRDTKGHITTIDVPGAFTTSASGINDAGQIVGSFVETEGFGESFLLTGGTFITVDVPGAESTTATSINNTGQIVGSFFDGKLTHGFLATPVLAGTPGKANCHGQSVSALAKQYGGLNNGAAALGYPNVAALQEAILAYCGG
jgi:uncharacterized membrane protein